MPFAKLTEVELGAMAREVLAALHRSDAHPIPSTKGMTFADIERRAHAVGRRVAAELTAEASADAAEDQAPSADRPACAAACRVTRKKRPVTTLDGPVEYPEPAAHCVACRRDFFPQRPGLRLNERSFGPELQRRLVETAARTKSFEVAAAVADLRCEHLGCSRTLARIAEEVGAELVAERTAMVGEFTHHRRGPEGVDPEHDLAAVFVDGGRVQLRDGDSAPGVHGERWAEDKIARLQTMTTRCHPSDPCPELPACFRRPILHAAPKPADSPIDSGDFLDRLESTAPDPKPAPWQPAPAIRTGVATMEPLEGFRWMVRAEAKRRHFYTAKKRAFVADGSHGNWTLHARHFADFAPILDFVHAAEYLHAASKALDSATLGCEWVRDLWRGRSAEVIAALRAALDAGGIGGEALDEKHALHPLQRAWTYLGNASGKLDYPRYRREGLPTTSGPIESQVKEFNARLKGSEKFWHDSNAEAMLELVNWTLREDGPTLASYFDRRTTSAFRRTYPTPLAA